MLNFREWFVINENREEKLLALELAGDTSIITSLSEVIPQNDKNTDKLLLLAAYYYSKTKNLQQIKTDMTDYIKYLKNNRVTLITVDLLSKKPTRPWDNYLYLKQIINDHQGEDEDKKQSSFKPSDNDFQNEKPILTSTDGKIKVYEANNTEQCVILGRGQSFCISKPGNKMRQSYRDNQTSTFYFVYDDTRPADDRLGIVVIDARPNGNVLTDKVNKTGTTLDPYTGELTNDSNSYMKYLREKGIDVSKFVNTPKSPEEQEEQGKLGKQTYNLDWFVSLSPDHKSKYIGRGNILTDQQFDYLLNNKIYSLLNQYVKTGLFLPDYQVEKIATNRDLRDNYFHNRLIAVQSSKNLTKKEYSLLSSKQKESYYDNMNDDDKKIRSAIEADDLNIVKYLVEKIEEKGKKIPNFTASIAAEHDHLDILKYLVDEKDVKLNYSSVIFSAVQMGRLELVKYLVGKDRRIINQAIEVAQDKGSQDIIDYLKSVRNIS